MRRRFENINTVAGGKIPVFACSISAPTTTWRNTIGDVFYYFFITEGSNQVPQLKLSPSTHLIHSIYKISTIGSFVPIDTYVEL